MVLVTSQSLATSLDTQAGCRMALQSSGTISLADIAAELRAPTASPISLGDANVRALAGVSSGPVSLSNFYGKASKIEVIASNAASINAATAFGANYSLNEPKYLTIPAGVVVGPITVPTGMGGSLIITNRGEIHGMGGAPNGGAGGDAITSHHSITVDNYGAIRGGGGGGGQGGTGGIALEFTYEVYDYYASLPPGSMVSGWRYRLRIIGQAPIAGGTGGAGGAGRGYQSLSSSGAVGQVGTAQQKSHHFTYDGQDFGTDTTTATSGTGGAGGTGGDWADAGSVGATGGQSTYWEYSLDSATPFRFGMNASQAGFAGSNGGAAGRAITMLGGTLSLSNNGTINGAY